MILANEDMAEVSLYRAEVDEQGNVVPGEFLFASRQFASGDYLYIAEPLPEIMPSLLLSWTDSEGEMHTAWPAESGKDGSLQLVELK